MADWPIKVLSFLRISFFGLAIWQLVGIAGLLPQTDNPETLRQPAIQFWIALKVTWGVLLVALAVVCGWAKKRLLLKRARLLPPSQLASPTVFSNEHDPVQAGAARPLVPRRFAIVGVVSLGLVALAVILTVAVQSNSTNPDKLKPSLAGVSSNGDTAQRKFSGPRGTSSPSNSASNLYRPPEIGGKSAVADPVGYSLAKLAAIGHKDCSIQQTDQAKTVAAISCLKRGERGDSCTDTFDGWETVRFKKPGTANSEPEVAPDYPVEVNFCPEFGGKGAWLKVSKGMTREQLTQLLGPPDRSEGSADGVAFRYEYRNGGTGKILISHQGQVTSWSSP